ncbi:MAG: glucosamine-6-phosphate deaminase [Anaerolineales bacterium]
MKLEIVENYQALSQLAAQRVIDALNQKPESVLVFPTGNTPLGMYQELAKAAEFGRVSFSQATLVALDDYYRIPMDDERNLFRWLDRALISKVDFHPNTVIRFETDTDDPQGECARIEQVLDQLGGIDLLVLGLGTNGHLGFNEPGTDFDSRTRVINLSPASIDSNARYWGSKEAVPKQGMTLGLKTLASARETVLLVSGKEKADILKKILTAPVVSKYPATILREFNNVTVIADQESARLLAH